MRARLNPEEFKKNIGKAIEESVALRCALRAVKRVKARTPQSVEDYVNRLIEETVLELAIVWRKHVDKMIEDLSAELNTLSENAPERESLQQKLESMKKAKDIYDREGVERFVKILRERAKTQQAGQASTPQPGPSTAQQAGSGTGTGQASTTTTTQPGSAGPSTTTPTQTTTQQGQQTTSETTQTEGDKVQSGRQKDSANSQTSGAQQ